METVLQTYGLTKQYGSFTALSNLDLALERGKIIGLLGPNGSGKTTFIKLCCGLIKPTAGDILICGMPIGVETKKVVSYLPDRNFIPDDMKVNEMLRFFQDFYSNFNVAKAQDMMNRLGINPAAKFKTMSKGTKEKVQLCLVMSREADVYLLDEPIAGVDPAARDYILNTIISNYNERAALSRSCKIFVSPRVLDDVVMIQNGMLRLHKSVDAIHNETGKSVDQLFREVYRC